MYDLKGNSCRSTIAEAVFLHKIKYSGIADQWDVDSAAIADWNVGRNPEPRAIMTMHKHGLLPYTHRTRQVNISP